MRDLDQAVDIFIGECARRGFTRASLDKYQYVLFPFVAANQEKLPWEITPEDCRRYLDRWRNNAKSTIALYTTILTRFFEFLYQEQIIEETPMARIKRPPLPRPEELDVVTVTSAQVEKLYEAVEEWDEQLCIALLTYLGPRRSAAAKLRRSDIDFERGTIRFKEKGGKVITKPVPFELIAILRAADEAGVWTSENAYVIPNRRRPRRKGERSDKVIYARIKGLAKRAGVEVHPHALRAAFAVHYLEQKPGDAEALQRLMGHTRMETTEIYLRRHDRFKAMERVRDLSWGERSVFPPSQGMPPTGFEPVLGEERLSKPLRRKLEQLRARTKERA